ncbi:phosphate ABC transporter, membrane protein PstA [Syntrophotalea carbinolica DSM 2380]|uniref:Phosphate transport system permease protein PstA n=1 Tax=Syntrophotalea carbinolica (strain DSM 2380 / NBRC 103641 / GraBd1) TaxID=338963 RepID=Q3A6U1_SYNC1|nr:phosphate ABC transporter permease PstA [Syntrophotalea carbinolica]ABA87916.1 phosphate ABC transporter, membrane protein PstA [Syntrophotalea carbinolica DSM 2380]
MKSFWKKGEPFIWLTGAALSVTLLMAAVLIVVVLVNGLGVFWPSRVATATLHDGGSVMGEIMRREPVYEGQGERLQFKVGNRELYGLDFRWVDESDISSIEYLDDAVVLERMEYGNFYGCIVGLSPEALAVTTGEEPMRQLRQAHEYVLQQKEHLEALDEKVAAVSYRMERLQRKEKSLLYKGRKATDADIVALRQQQDGEQQEFHRLLLRQSEMAAKVHAYRATFADASGSERSMPLMDLVRFYQPNSMSVFNKVHYYLIKLVELFCDSPRESNTEGGLFPAIFGTVMLIFIMSLFSFPLGVLAAVYLREYAREGLIVRLVRIAVNNLAGIPSIVYGIFGLAFFVYGIGGSIDRMFFPEQLPTPTFGTGGILWASLTLSLLTVPVVIVATEEALGAIPAGVREGSLALGATKFQTLTRILLPMASPGIMTGLILAMARAAGEVAPLMITGVVKIAPALPVDGTFPFVHLDRKFMHLGFHIYDIGFQSPNVEAAKPMVFVTTLLLVLIVLVMSSVAIYLRNKMKKRYTYGTF